MNRTTTFSVRAFALLCLILLCSMPLVAQVPYTPFPKDSLSWNIWGESYDYIDHPLSFSMSGQDITIENKTYTKVFGYGELITGIREENKRIYAHIPEYGELLLYDFNLDIGDTIFYNIGLFVKWGSGIGGYQPAEHYAVVVDKGTITLNNGSIRNIITLQIFSWTIRSIQWIEGIGATEMVGLLDPLVYDQALDGTQIWFICACESNSAAGCLLYLYTCGNHPGILAMGCPCNPNNNVFENEKNEIVLYPNPTMSELIIKSEGARVEKIEVFDVFGRKQTVRTEVFMYSEIKIDISYLVAGIYFVKIFTETGEVIKKVLKE